MRTVGGPGCRQSAAHKVQPRQETGGALVVHPGADLQPMVAARAVAEGMPALAGATASGCLLGDQQQAYTCQTYLTFCLSVALRCQGVVVCGREVHTGCLCRCGQPGHWSSACPNAPGRGQGMGRGTPSPGFRR